MSPSADDPPVAPDRETLLKATALALVVAGVVLLVAVLPAEYGVDPTGLGEAMGLTRLSGGETDQGPRVRLGGEPFRTAEAEVTVPANDGIEWKLEVEESAPVVFTWTSNGTALYTDFHGEPRDAPEGEFTSWRQETTTNQSGDMRAPFAGTVGWYWENRGDDPVTVEVRAAGVFEVVGTLG